MGSLEPSPALSGMARLLVLADSDDCQRIYYFNKLDAKSNLTGKPMC